VLPAAGQIPRDLPLPVLLVGVPDRQVTREFSWPACRHRYTGR